jgi:hypothetical protein
MVARNTTKFMPQIQQLVVNNHAFTGKSHKKGGQFPPSGFH